MPKNNSRRILRAMEHNPQWLVRRARRYENSRVRLSGRKLQRWIKRYEHRPLSMLGECYGTLCPNSRLKYPEKRRQFVREAICLIKQKFGATNLGELHVVMVGSGSLLQEAIFLSQLCQAINIKNMHVTLCDEEYCNKNQDASRILTARFQQIQSWMAHIAPLTLWSWSAVSAWGSIKFVPGQPTILFAADIEMTHELREKINAAAYSSQQRELFVAAMLDSHGIIHGIKSD